jgi:hypothetical protein
MLTRKERAEQRAALPELPVVLTPTALRSRPEVEEYRGRRQMLLSELTTPACVSTDAACGRGISTLAYTSKALGERVETIRCENSTRAEFLALLMAMDDVEKAAIPGPIEYQIDCTAVANYRTMRDAGFKRLRVQLDDFMGAHSNWRLMLIRGSENRAANALARKALVGWGADK